MRLILASGSSRRAYLLEDAGYDFEIIPADIDETPSPGESAPALVERLASEKAREVAAGRDGVAVLGADTIVATDDEILGKPVDAAEAMRMLRSLSGREHNVMTGWAVITNEETIVSHTLSVVSFRELSDQEILGYIASGEPFDRAGAYAIQGGAGEFVSSVKGPYLNVVGLPVAAVAVALRKIGIHPSERSEEDEPDDR